MQRFNFCLQLLQALIHRRLLNPQFFDQLLALRDCVLGNAQLFIHLVRLALGDFLPAGELVEGDVHEAIAELVQPLMQQTQIDHCFFIVGRLIKYT